ncbi:secretoglobin family 3A member 1 [Eumetopias jubatus]|uniref:secretoglobin family 3A member 1 n=1 Tax=Eumetopias jubatus TaxID=34886 RepID=UPI001016289D|nr:secretoglobin family 3A member 1 [Eumetopias jubatus]
MGSRSKDESPPGDSDRGLALAKKVKKVQIPCVESLLSPAVNDRCSAPRHPEDCYQQTAPRTVKWEQPWSRSTVKLTAAFLALCVALLSHPGVHGTSWRIQALGRSPQSTSPDGTVLLYLCLQGRFVNSTAKPVASTSNALNPAAEAGAGAMAGVGARVHPFLGGFNLLKFMLSMVGIPAEHLVEGSRKCVAELGPEAREAMGAMKALLGALMYFA